jgi:hypothetical protein
MTDATATEPKHPSLAHKIPIKYREWGYAAGTTIGATYVAFELAYGAPKWMTVLFAAFTSTGFYVARRNT